MSTAFPLTRNVAALKSTKVDLLVVGGGIYGAWTAYDAAQRGLSVALIEKNDWGSGTSSASSKLIHGGLRYLEHYEFGLVRHALKERRTLSQIAPHLVRPLNFILPVWRGPRAGMFMLSAGLTLYDLLAFGDQPVPRHKHFRAAELKKAYPYVDPERLLGGFRYGDCQEDDARMTMTVVAQAQAHGAVCANRVSATKLLYGADGVRGARLRDEVSGESFEIGARSVAATAGPWARQVLGEAAPKMKLIKGTHIVLPAIAGCTEAFLLTARDGRVFFVIPWYGKTLVGTTEKEVQSPAEAVPTEDEIHYLIEGVRSGLPGLGWTESDVLGAFAGARTLQAEDEANLSAVTREFDILEPRPGVWVPLGGKYTTSRPDSADIVDRVCRRLRHKGRSRTHATPLPGAPAGDFDTWQPLAQQQLVNAGLDEECARWCSLRHGTRIERLLTLIHENDDWRHRIHPDAPFIKAEAVLAAREEMALSAEDIGRRRMPLSLLTRDSHWREGLEQLIDP
jgi:glycerol-3-phosphate dehydrogenase